MEFLVEEMVNSWAHCKELIRSSARKEVVIAFLEDFKVQFTAFYNKIKSILKNKYQKLAFNMVDRAYFFWKKEGELTQIINFINTHWDAKHQVMKRIDMIDAVVTKILSQYQKTTISL